MLWGKKEEKKSLPDLPPLKKAGFDIEQSRSREIVPPQGEEFEEEVAQKQEFPSFPDSMSNKGFSQAAIKDAVGDDLGERDFSRERKPSEMTPMKYLPPHSDTSYKTVEMEEWSPSVSNQGAARQNSNIRLGEPPEINFSRTIPEIQKVPKNADIFVKLDKFYSARKALIDAQQKMEDIDELLKRIRETKMREEQELIAWERELMGVKARMNDITVNIFEKVD